MTELAVKNLTVRFGGLTALDDVSFTVASGAVHALIGPNGAGKSTCFNVVSGVYRANSGRVSLGERDLTRVAAHRRARMGLGRSFQHVHLSPHSSVLDNVMLGRHARTSGGFFKAAVRWPPTTAQQRRHALRATEICEFIGLGERMHEQAGSLPYGDEKRVDIARALATEPEILMLDEPTAGMNAAETAAIGQTIRDVRDALGISVLLVEHDMGLVMGIADRVTVLDFGEVVADDIPEKVRNDPEVIRAYLGEQDSEPGENTGNEPPAQDEAHGDERSEVSR